MNTVEAMKMVIDLFEEFGLMEPGNQWQFRWDNAKRRFGCCYSKQRTISLSKPLTLLNNRSEVEDVIRHEIAHALAPVGSHHDAAWKRMCLVTGARPERCYDSSQVVQPPARYWVVCESCGVIGKRQRAPRREVYHPPCGSDVKFVKIAS